MNTELNYYFNPENTLPPSYLSASSKYVYKSTHAYKTASGILLKESILLNFVDSTRTLKEIKTLKPLPWKLVNQIRLEHTIDSQSIIKIYFEYLLDVDKFIK